MPETAAREFYKALLDRKDLLEEHNFESTRDKQAPGYKIARKDGKAVSAETTSELSRIATAAKKRRQIVSRVEHDGHVTVSFGERPRIHELR